MPRDPKLREDGPLEDRLSQLANVGVRAMEGSEFFRATDKMVILLDNMGERRGGSVTHGYDDHRETLVRLTEQAQALAQTLGVELRFTSEAIE